MKRILFAFLVLAGCETNQPAERYGFVARLGRDTASVESVTRSGNTLVSDEVDRFPRVRQRHTEIKLGDEIPTTPVEKFTVSIHPVDARRGTLVLEWGSFRWTAPIQVQ